MNRIKTLVFLAVAATLQTAPSLTAQQQTFEAKVPFQFSAGDRTLPAGEYRISRRNAFLQIQNQDDYTAVTILSSNGDPSGDGRIHLVFDEVNDHHFLRRVDAPASLGSIELAISRGEKRARMDQQRFSTANPSGSPTQIIVTGAQ